MQPITSIHLTENTIAKLHALLADEKQKHDTTAAVYVRIAIQGGGCSGFEYSFSFDDMIHDDDGVIEVNGTQVLVDLISYEYLNGAKIDYRQGLEGERFVIDNPNAQTTCGCGSSFSAKEKEA